MKIFIDILNKTTTVKVNTMNKVLSGMVILLATAVSCQVATANRVYQGAAVTPLIYRGDLRDLPRAPFAVPVSSSQKQQNGKSFDTPFLNFPGIAFTGVFPPDMDGAAGPDHYLQMTSALEGSAIAVFDKAGALLAGPVLLNSLWTAGGPCQNDGRGSPIVLYDQLADRWLLSERAGFSSVCLYISTGPDPLTGGWFLYLFDMPESPEYPQYAVWLDAYYLTTSEFGGPAVYALDRDRMLNGQAATFQRFSAPALEGLSFFSTQTILTPANWDGDTAPSEGAPAYFIRPRDDEKYGRPESDNQPLSANTGSWQSATLDISSALGSANVVIRFGFSNDFTFTTEGGFYVDDIIITAGNDLTLLSEDFENGATGWNGTDLWHLTNACNASLEGHSPVTTFYYGRDAGCNYGDDSANFHSGTLDSPTLDLSGVSGQATLSFNYFLGIGNLCFFALGDIASVQISSDGGTTFNILSWNCDDPVFVPTEPEQDLLELWRLSVDFDDPAQSVFSGPLIIPTDEFDSEFCGFDFACFPQPGTTQQLEARQDIAMWRLQYRNFETHETLLGNFVVDTDGTDHGGIHWFELRKSEADSWTVWQEGTVSPDDNNRWLGSIAMNGSGDIALGYSAAGSSLFPSIRYSGRMAGDPAGQLPRGEHTLIAGNGSQSSTSIWGRRSAMTVDPADDCTFWYTNAHVSTLGLWQTQISALRFGACGSNEIFSDNFETTPAQ